MYKTFIIIVQIHITLSIFLQRLKWLINIQHSYHSQIFKSKLILRLCEESLIITLHISCDDESDALILFLLLHGQR